ncbi:glycoside hydrolase family 16 protein [Sphingobacterium bambusae]|uniref:Glycoside hydrolase family 16 protein n=1 Tax=Sphingobacterium bambusae TaxID=662858 RepID=A0ABW6BDM5_9SPHI|nr:glycoside hydrolase family 16 protein [Sphingobacterium bambusae]WPL46944.1 glycoside hydrolase family 16 protein [Sphingobacterium bambusae]
MFLEQFSFLHVIRVCCLLSLLGACSSSTGLDDEELPTPTDRIISFSGFDWLVRKTGASKEGPGPNLFSDSEDNVWVDEQGRLHLKIVQKGGLWYCSGLLLRQSLGYGKYIFYVASDVSKLDQNVVGGLFTYRTDEEEIDIEFSKWSDPDNMDSQFAVQPSERAGNKVRYNLELTGEQSTHSFDWQPTYIDFFSLQGHSATVTPDNLIRQWRYTGANIPPDTDERLRINLWLFRGQTPSDKKEQEMIIEKVEYIK